MRTSHSSLLADTGLSEIGIEKLGIYPVEREEYDPELLNLVRHGLTSPTVIAQLCQTWRPFKGRPWHEDEDILNFLRYQGMDVESGLRPNYKR